MSDKGDNTRESDGLSRGRTDEEDRARRGRGRAQGPGDDTSMTRKQWEALSSDPDLEMDFGYRFAEWEEYSTLDGSDALMFLPTDESLLREDAFVVAAKEDVQDLEEWY